MYTVIPHWSFFFFFNDTATTEIYTLSLHDALPICSACFSGSYNWTAFSSSTKRMFLPLTSSLSAVRSEEHTSELQSQSNLVCRLLLEKKKSCNSAPKARARWPQPFPTAFRNTRFDL